MWHVYVARCGDGSLYAGIAKDPSERLKLHNSGKGSRYVRSKGPAELVFAEPCRTRSTALKRELEIKALSRQDKLALIASRMPE